MHVKLYYGRGFYRFIMVTPVRLLRIITCLFRRLLFFLFLFLSSDFKRQFRTPRSRTSKRGTILSFFDMECTLTRELLYTFTYPLLHHRTIIFKLLVGRVDWRMSDKFEEECANIHVYMIYTFPVVYEVPRKQTLILGSLRRDSIFVFPRWKCIIAHQSRRTNACQNVHRAISILSFTSFHFTRLPAR